MDLNEVYFCTKLCGKNSFFNPFNIGGDDYGKGNPHKPDGINVSYMWEEIWKKDAKVIWLKYEDTYQLLEPQKHGCYFKGWEATDEVIDDEMLVTMGLKDVVVTAKWQVREDVVAKIGNEYYFTLEEALAAAQPKDVIELLADVEENVHVGSNKEITLDMHGHIIQGAFINDGILILLDGVIENTDGIGLINNKTVTMGINDGEIEIGKVQIIGTTLGMEQNGNFNFYDGFIEGDVAMNGTTNSVPRGYFLYTEHNNIKDCQRTYLIGNPENAVAIISDVTTQYFFNLSDAIEAAHVSGKQIYIVKDFEAAYPVEVKEGYDIVINMNSYNITTGNLITNNGTLRIYDDSEVKGSINSARSIVNHGTMTIEDIQLKQNKSVDTIDNQGTLTVKNATVNATDHAGISNKTNANLTVEDSLITSNSGYAVHNDAGGTITLTGDYELTVTTGYGLDNYGTITNTLNSGHIVGIFSNTGFTTEDGLLVTNSTNKPTMSLRAATYNFNGGTFTATNDNTVYTEGGNITFNINGGTFTSTTNTGFYVANGTKSNFNITGGTITAKVHGIDHRGDNGTLILDNANIHADDTGIRVVNSNSKLTLNSGDVYGGLYGIYFYAARTVFTMTGGNVTGYTYDGFRDDYSSDSMTYNITGGHIKGGRYGIHKYNDYLVVENATIETTSNNRDHYALHTSWGSVRLKSGARIIAERASGIWAEDALTMDEGSYIYAGAYNAYGIAERWMNSFNMNGGTIETPGPSALGFYSYEDVLVFNMNGGTINSGNVGLSLTAGNNVTRNVNIYGGSIIGKTYGVQQTNSYYNTIIGKESDELSTEVPYISGGLYGYYKTAGTFKFFGGRLRGKTFGYSGTYNLIRHAKEITTYVEDVEGVEDILTYSTTSTSATATANTAKSGNGYARLTYLGETTDLCEYNQTYTYDYTGQEEIFIIPCAGKYSLEVWGAQGGYGIQDGNKNAGTPGYGGYAYGEIDFDVNETLFINVGGKGENGSLTSCAAGGYNGGGRGTNDGGECINPYDDDASGGGGGATHIATSSGLLSELANNKSSVIIVAGGGGGASYNKTGGSGGGYIGGIANNGNTIYQSGTQTSGYAFGRGKDGEGLRQNGTCGLDTPSCVGVAGGGAGYYGGLNTDNDVNSSGTGGSGYIANERITNGVMYGYNVEATVGTWYNNYLIDKEAFLQVGTETFNTFDEASAAIEENGSGTIVVLKDTELMDIATIVGNRTITLDLNGHVIESKYNNIINESNLTIIDSSNEKTGEIKATVHRAIETKGSLTLDGVKISGTSSGYSTIYGSSGTGTITVKDSTITGVGNAIVCDAAYTIIIENSTLTADSSGVAMNKPGARVEMKSGTITAKKHGIFLNSASSSTVIVEDGVINSTENGIYVLNAGSSSVTYETGTISSGIHGICFENSANGTLVYKDGEITAGNVGIYFNNSGNSTLTYKQGEITASNVGLYANSSANVTLNYTTGNITSENIGIDYNESGSSNIHIYDISINAKNQGLYNHSASNNWIIDTATITSRESKAIDFATYNSNRNTLTITDGTYTAATHGVVQWWNIFYNKYK